MNGAPAIAAGLVVIVTATTACVTAPAHIREREDYWRRELAEQVPIGTGRAEVVAMYERHGLPFSAGTYRSVAGDGTETSHCRLPERALSALERSAVRGLYLKWDVEVTVCLDEGDTVESHFIGAWNAGI